MRWAAFVIASCLLIVLAGCTTSHVFVDEPNEEWRDLTPPDAEPAYRVFLIGDVGDATSETPALHLLKRRLAEVGENGAAVFLGDNVYPSGLPDSTDPARAEAEARLMAQLRIVKDFPGRVVFIPGNHDWNHGRPGGREALARQEALVEAYLDRGNVFLPDNGFPGPVEVELTDEITLVALDTEWWLSEERTFGDTGEYTLNEPSDFLLEFEDVLYDNRKKNVLVVGHHPIFSNGKHGGHFSWKEHLSPVPVIGSINPLYRRFIGRRQDLAHEDYRLFRREMLKLFEGREHLIYASGHDHSLQYFRRGEGDDTQHYLVSGAGAEAGYVAHGHGASFAAAEEGFIALQYYEDGSVWMEAWSPTEDGRSGRLLYREPLKPPQPDLRDQKPVLATDGYPDYRDSTVVRAVNARYARVPGIAEVFLGDHYRNVWATPVRAPVLDIERVAGGLTPIKLGGRSQSITLRFQGEDEKFYMLRSIDKVAGRTWPAEMQRTAARGLVQDQVSMLHPYGAFIAAPLAEAAGIFHTNPRLVYVPEDPRLGVGAELLGGQLALFEERPDEDMSDVASVGYASNVIGTTKLLEEVTADNDHRVDARAFARARLLDMLISDGDRTPDNFRWSAFEPYELNPTLEGEAREQGKVYLPVPIDRDAAFMQVDGLFPVLYSLFLEPTWQDFDHSYGYLRGLNQKGLPLDRRFTASLSREDWVELADRMRLSLTDDAIEEAVRRLPPPVYERIGGETIEKLKARRDELPKVADRYYDVLAHVVDVVGSHKHERFEVTRLNDEATEVVVYKTSKEGEIREEIFRRTFHLGETEEVRLYGLDGQDQFIFNGDVRDGIRVIAVGGGGGDVLVDSSTIQGWRKRTRYYDTPIETTVATEGETRIILRDDPDVNRYELEGYRYNTTSPIGFFGSNEDDGVFVGGGVRMIRHAFRKDPYAYTHQIMGNFAARTAAFNVRYQGHFVSVLGPWDVLVNAAFYNPNNIRNFYGLGNETVRGRDAEYYQARLTRIHVKPLAGKALRRGISFYAGPTFEYTNVREDEDRFVGNPQPGISPGTFDELYYGGAQAQVALETVASPVNPKQGLRLTGAIDLNTDILDVSNYYATLSSEAVLYLSPTLSPQITFATRLGAAHTLGEFPFFAANTLGGTTNLRGYRSHRFAGRTSAYQNLDLRVEVFDFSSVFGYGRAGVLGFFDSGRVWADEEQSRLWHTGYGGGAWALLFDTAVVTATYGLSTEDRLFALQLGFLF